MFKKIKYNIETRSFWLTAIMLAFFIFLTPLHSSLADEELSETTTTSTTTIYPSKFYNTDRITPTKHIFANGAEVGTVTDTGEKAVPRYTHTDQLNGSNIVTNSSDTIDEVLDYFPFGKTRIDFGSYSDQRKYIGQEYDAATGLSYLNARYYDSKGGHFISEDPQFWNFDKSWLLDPQNQNSYSYARNNPINLSDPSGKNPFLLTAILFFGDPIVGSPEGDINPTTQQFVDAQNTQNKFLIGSLLIPGEAEEKGASNIIDHTIKCGGELGSKMNTIVKGANTVGRALMQEVDNESVLNLIKENYKISSIIGDGSTADAVMHTVHTGELVKGSNHIVKANEVINGIRNIIKKYGSELNSQEKKVLNQISNGLKKALKSTKK